MFALIFLSIGLLATAQMIPLASSQIVSSRNHTLAVEEAQNILQDLQSADFSSADLVAGSHSAVVGRFTNTYTVTDNTPVPGSKRVDLVVGWSESGGTKTVDYSTILSP